MKDEYKKILSDAEAINKGREAAEQLARDGFAKYLRGGYVYRFTKGPNSEYEQIRLAAFKERVGEIRDGMDKQFQDELAGADAMLNDVLFDPEPLVFTGDMP